MGCSHNMSRILLLALIVLFATGCAAPFTPRPLEEVNFLQRAESQSQANLRVTAAVLHHQ